jgi:hypothetical protein
MKRKFFNGMVIFACIFIFIRLAYACEPINIIIWDDIKHTVANSDESDWAEVIADVEAGGPATEWNWIAPPELSIHSYSEHDYYSGVSFWSPTTGRYQVWAEAWNDVPSYDSDWAYVYVFLMDLDISGVNDEDEEDPGEYICVNDDDDNNNGTPDKDETGTVSGEDDLVAISLSYEPSNLDPGYIELKIPYSDSIKVWSSSEKGTLVLDKDHRYKRWQVGSQPSTLWVEGYSTGTLQQLWLGYSNSTNPYQPSYPGGEKNHDTVKFTVYNAELKSIWFKSDHGLLKDNNTDWTNSGTTYSQPEWIPDGPDGGTDPDQNNPISHTKNIKLTADVKVRVEPSGWTFDLIGDGPDNYVDFNKTNITSTGYDQIVTVSANANLPNQVDTLTKSISWTIKLLDPDPDIEVNVGSSGPHKIYVTFGTPTGSVVTEKRMNWACLKADGATTENAAASLIQEDLHESDPPYFQGDTGPNPYSPIWLMMNTSPQYPGDCIAHANLMKHAIKLLGISASYAFVADATNQPSENTPNNIIYWCETHGRWEEKWFREEAEGVVWSFEGVCGVSSTYYDVACSTTSGTYAYCKTVGNGIVYEWVYVYESGGQWYDCEDQGGTHTPYQ